MIDQIRDQHDKLLKENVDIKVLCITTIDGMNINEDGLDLTNWREDLKTPMYKFGPSNVDDIIKFAVDNYYVIHRVYAIEETENGIVFTTKGDNNNAPDSKPVRPEQIQAVYKTHVKFLGFPSVWLSEALR